MPQCQVPLAALPKYHSGYHHDHLPVQLPLYQDDNDALRLQQQSSFASIMTMRPCATVLLSYCCHLLLSQHAIMFS